MQCLVCTVGDSVKSAVCIVQRAMRLVCMCTGCVLCTMRLCIVAYIVSKVQRAACSAKGSLRVHWVCSACVASPCGRFYRQQQQQRGHGNLRGGQKEELRVDRFIPAKVYYPLALQGGTILYLSVHYPPSDYPLTRQGGTDNLLSLVLYLSIYYPHLTTHFGCRGSDNLPPHYLVPGSAQYS